MLILKSGIAESRPRLEKRLLAIQKVVPAVRSLNARFVYLVDCNKPLTRENIEILKELALAKSKVIMKYPPRSSKPESWRPQNASHWSSQWMKILAEIHYHELSNDWRLIASNTHSIVAGFGKDNTIYLIDIILLTNNPEEIIKKLSKE